MSESPLYWQKIRSDSTQIERNALIQQLQAQLRDANIEALALEWSKRHGLLALDLGGAHGCPKAYTPVDRVEIEGGIKCNLADSGLPLADRSVGVIRAMDFLEHIPIGRVVPMMNDLHRVLRHGGMLITATPSTDGRGAFCDPTHCSFWNELSFRYYSDARYSKYVPEIACRFQVVTLKTVTFSDWHRQNNLPYVVANLCANHGDRLPGMKMI